MGANGKHILDRGVGLREIYKDHGKRFTWNQGEIFGVQDHTMDRGEHKEGSKWYTWSQGEIFGGKGYIIDRERGLELSPTKGTKM